jgi:hypothetical protein
LVIFVGKNGNYNAISRESVKHKKLAKKLGSQLGFFFPNE